MNKTEKLLTLLQPVEYKSKIKLFCRDKKTEENLVEKVANIKLNNYLRIIEIKEL